MAGAIRTSGTSRGRMVSIDVKVEGVDKTSAEFKAISRDINTRIRDVMVGIGDRELLPLMRAGFPRLSTPRKGVQAGLMAASLKTVRERSGVFVGSTLRGRMNRAMGWIDFGGKRPADTKTRVGPKVMVRTLDAKRALIDTRVLEELEREFRGINHP